MDALADLIKFILIGLIVIIFGAAIWGYSCSNCGGCIACSNLSSNPCIPVLANGKINPHYHDSWYDCRFSCGANSSPRLDVKTCKCSCN